MNWDAIGAIGEILGSLGVLVSLIYLGIQIKSNTTQLRFNEGHALAEAADRGFEPIYYEPSMSIWTKGHRNLSQLTEDERMIFDALMVRNLQNFQNSIIAKREALIDEEVFQKTLIGFLRKLLDTPGGAEWFSEHKGFFIGEIEEVLRGANLERK